MIKKCTKCKIEKELIEFTKNKNYKDGFNYFCKEWMTWDNHGNYDGTFYFGWDYDHIIPLSTAKTKKDIIKLNHYTNYQPLCSHINRDIKK